MIRVNLRSSPFIFSCTANDINDQLGEPSLRKNGKIWENFPKGWGVKKSDENSQFQFGNLENPGGVGLDFSKMSEL